MKRLLTSVMLPVAVALAVVAVVLAAVVHEGWLTVGINSSSRDSQVINAVERTQEVSLIALNIQGIDEEDRNSTIFGQDIPGTGEKVFLQYSFTAKLGLAGDRVTVQSTGASAYLVSLPRFAFIGYDNLAFQVAAEDAGILSWITPDVDKVEMVNKLLNSEDRQQYVDSNDSVLKDQAKDFYGNLIHSIDPAAKVTYDFG